VALRGQLDDALRVNCFAPSAHCLVTSSATLGLVRFGCRLILHRLPLARALFSDRGT
jgi:hypothetical protein